MNVFLSVSSVNDYQSLKSFLNEIFSVISKQNPFDNIDPI